MPAPIRLRVVVPNLPRTILNQRNKSVPIFKGKDPDEPNWQCGDCGNTLATATAMGPCTPGAMRFLPFPEGGDYSVLSVDVPVGTHVASVEGPILVKCGDCGAFNELVPIDSE